MKALIEKNLISGVRITTDAGQERMSIPGATDHLIGLSRAQRVEVMVKYHRSLEYMVSELRAAGVAVQVLNVR